MHLFPLNKHVATCLGAIKANKAIKGATERAGILPFPGAGASSSAHAPAWHTRLGALQHHVASPSLTFGYICHFDFLPMLVHNSFCNIDVLRGTKEQVNCILGSGEADEAWSVIKIA